MSAIALQSESKTVLGIGDLGVIGTAGETMKTFALGSCVAVVLFCPKTLVTGMVHIALPNAATDMNKAQKQPGYFADTGLPELIRRMRFAGCLSPLREITAKLIGGASVIHFSNSMFNIGERNMKEILQILEKVRIQVVAKDTGGSISRTVEVTAGSKIVKVNSPAIGTWEL